MSHFAVNPLVSETTSPAILEARAWLNAYDGRKGPAIDLSQAAPPYPPPESLLEQLGQAAQSAEAARYGPVRGELALREAYARHVSRLYQTDISVDGVAITGGCNQAFLIAAMLVAQKGDAVILPVPWYFNHKMTLDMLGIAARPWPCEPGHGFKPTIAALEATIDPSVRAAVLVTPNNPTGAIYSPAEIEAIARICHARGIWLIIDETYRDFLPQGAAKAHALFEAPFRDGVISLYSFSKSLAMPGHRVGAMIYRPAVADDVIKIQDCIQICPNRAAQLGAVWALQNLDAWRAEKRRSFADKARDFQDVLRQANGWIVDSIGAYFAYVRHPHPELSADQVARRLASENGLLLIPGSYFGPGQERHLRVSFGNLEVATLRDLPDRLRL